MSVYVPWSCERAVPAAPSCPSPGVLDRLAPLSGGDSDRELAADELADLRGCIADVDDPWDRRGVWHSLVSILGIAAVAVAAGARSFTAIAEWAADAPQQVLALLGVRRQPRTGGLQVPDEATIRRVLTRLDGDNLDSAISVWLRAHPGGEADAGPEVVAAQGFPVQVASPAELLARPANDFAGRDRGYHALGFSTPRSLPVFDEPAVAVNSRTARSWPHAAKRGCRPGKSSTDCTSRALRRWTPVDLSP
ncbi:transposase family protein [Saccharopolyspora sp. NPDC002376]